MAAILSTAWTEVTATAITLVSYGCAIPELGSAEPHFVVGIVNGAQAGLTNPTLTVESSAGGTAITTIPLLAPSVEVKLPVEATRSPSSGLAGATLTLKESGGTTLATRVVLCDWTDPSGLATLVNHSGSPIEGPPCGATCIVSIVLAAGFFLGGNIYAFYTIGRAQAFPSKLRCGGYNENGAFVVPDKWPLEWQCLRAAPTGIESGPAPLTTPLQRIARRLLAPI